MGLALVLLVSCKPAPDTAPGNDPPSSAVDAAAQTEASGIQLASTSGVLPEIELYTWGPAWGYLDGDERPDLFVPHHYGHQVHGLEDLLLLNRPNGFRPTAKAPSLGLHWPQSRDQHAAVFAPLVSRDPGALDLYVSVGGAQGDESARPRIEALLLVQEQGRLVNRAVELGVQEALARGPLLRGRIALPFDADRDGRLDLLLLGEDGPARLLRRLEDHFVDASREWNVDAILPGRGEGWRAALADLDGDGREDLALPVGPGSRLGYHLQRRGSFAGEQAPHGIDPGRGIASVTALREGADRAADLVLMPQRAGREDALTLVHNHEDGSSSLERIASIALRGGGVHANSADLDNDGDPDLLIVTRRELRVLENRGPGDWRDVTVASGLDGAANLDGQGLARAGQLGCASFADYDLDGRVDLALARGWGGPGEPRNHAGPLILVRNVGRAGHWLRLRLIGRAEPSAIGATVRVTTSANGDRYLQVGSGVVGTCQNDPAIHVGLGSERAADVVVEWPSGRRTEHPSLAADRTHWLVEDDTDEP